ncbi:MAG: phosphomannomutase/phosphoglucomutase [Rhodospirillales bacterium]|nr:phosphomannomutase/phosphoglucomutase [Rhodospirillales bacterium]
MSGAAPHRFHPTILREYDIRGIVGETLFAADARAIGLAFATRIAQDGGTRIAVGRDGRLSSPELAAALIEGLLAAGMTVEDVGLGPTPMLYYAAKARKTDGAIMVTGSHNPPSHNGFKMMRAGQPFFGPDIVELGRTAAAGVFAQGAGRRETVEILESYVERLAMDYDGARPLSIVWDAGNGAAGAVLAELVARLPGRHTLLFAEVDGRFPNHHPDPTEPDNLVDLQKAVAAEKADLGFAFDGDADRLGVVDGLGKILWGDQILLLLAEDILKDLPGATIIADVKASQALFDGVAQLGGKPLMWKTGHSLIKTKMAETGAPLAGEMSGHLFLADRYFGFDDALYAAVRFAGLVARLPESLAQRHARMPKLVNTPEIRIPCAEDKKFAAIRAVKERLAAAGATVDDTDGVRVMDDDGWWLLRASNTQAVLVARAEAGDTAGLARLKARLAQELRQSGIAPPKELA